MIFIEVLGRGNGGQKGIERGRDREFFGIGIGMEIEETLRRTRSSTSVGDIGMSRNDMRY
jgi:hypothetical protein